MNFRFWFESVDFESLRARATGLGLDLYRGVPQKKIRHELGEFARDVGDFGRGVYYSSERVHAAQYGKVGEVVVKFENPIVMGVQDAYKLSDKFNILHPPEPPRDLMNRALAGDVEAQNRVRELIKTEWQPLKNAEEMTKYFLKKDHDGLIVVHSGGRLEVVDFRPYRG